MFHILAFDSDRDDLVTVADYELGGFDIVSFWRGSPLMTGIPESLRIYVDNDMKVLPDYMGNPLALPICSQRFSEHLVSYASSDIELHSAPLFRSGADERLGGYVMVNAVRKVPCLDVERSQVGYAQDGSLSAVFKYTIASRKVPADMHIFRVAEHPYSILFSDELAQSLRGKGMSGVAFIRARSA